MKQSIIILSSLVLLFSCNKKETVKEEKSYKDSLLVVKNDSINVLIRKYNAFEQNYIKAYKEDDRGLLKLYSDSTNYYDNVLFSTKTLQKLDSTELVLFNEQINKIRYEKIKSLSNKND